MIGRLMLFLLAAAFLVAGTLMLASALYSIGRLLTGPVTERDLRVVNGRLSRVSPCSTGRRARFEYVVSDGDRHLGSVAGCPSAQQQELAGQIGAPATVRYVDVRDTFFLPEVRVYELVVAGRALWTFSQTAERDAQTRGLAYLLSVLGGLVGIGLVWTGWRDLNTPLAASGSTDAHR